MNLSRNGERLLLTYERSGFELLTGPVFMVALVVLVLLAAAIVVTSVIYGKGLEITLLMLFGVGIGCASIYEESLDADCTTEFDLASRSITVTMSGLWNRQLGPISFDDVDTLDTVDGSVGRHRAAIATLMLTDGSKWRLGHEGIWVRRVATSMVPSLLTKIRHTTGLAGTDAT